MSVSLFLFQASTASGKDKDKSFDLFSDITEPSGWNDVLDQAWRAAVDQARSSTVLMECVLLLEHYIHKNWLAVRVLRYFLLFYFSYIYCTLQWNRYLLFP